MASEFDIDSGGGISIFTNNNSEDMFYTDGDIEPNFLIDQGPKRGIADVGKIQNLAGGITVDTTNEAPVVFDSVRKPSQSSNVKKAEDFTSFENLNNNETGIFAKPTPRQKVDSFTSVASNATVEAEASSTRSNRKPSGLKKMRNRSLAQDIPPSETKTVNMNKPAPTPVPKHSSSFEASEPVVNFGFDDLLDSRKLEPSKEVSNDPPPFIPSPESSPIRSHYDFPSNSNPSPNPSYSKPSYSKPDSSNNAFSNNEFSDLGSSGNTEVPKYSSESEERLDLLVKLQSLERKGVSLSKHFGPKSTLYDLRIEYTIQSKKLESEAGVKFMRKGLIFCTSGMEYLNRRFDPVGAKLDGWGESVMENQMDYDGIFERLHEKYSGSAEMEPELELLFALGGSAFMFHMSHTLFKNAIPQFGNVLKENPDLVQGIFGAAKEAASRNQQGQQNPMASNSSTGGLGSSNVGSRNMEPPPFDLGSLMSTLGLGGGGGGNGPDLGGLMSQFGQAMGQNPLPRAVPTQDLKDPAVSDMYRKMMEQQAHIDEDNLSVSSHDSTRSLGQGSKKVTISPNPKSRRGGNIIKL
jgi:hypothetical protein